MAIYICVAVIVALCVGFVVWLYIVGQKAGTAAGTAEVAQASEAQATEVATVAQDEAAARAAGPSNESELLADLKNPKGAF
ncbi:hypothetical protein [Acetobacter sp. UBA5411]|uniref:hypothetical protein n=1 Tax=Acetobacter sp. UBA5411 TaxID=1945905 RepID=UPI0025C66C31|nr:hypothetical protein [Acetobacter sp. UBA5411]